MIVGFEEVKNRLNSVSRFLLYSEAFDAWDSCPTTVLITDISCGWQAIKQD